ncbi:Hint domain-containing protein [Maritalea mobilis]|uniref:Hint domain-containing protein n=1 Tax=Maritalea mobilis TaxID=483324 RepID=UPI001C97F6A1|nr:Hint domain-containing protein [Maritalea mobilis]MBY6199815.1 Hint domain-containing protein [Maritalea mobilis]
MNPSQTGAASGSRAVSALRIGQGAGGVAPDAQIMTADGIIPAAYLSAGDRIITRRGIRPLRAILRRSLRPGAPCVLVSKDALGGKPERDVVLLPGQRVLIRDWRAKAMWGREAAAPELRQLVDGQYIRWVEDGPEAVLQLYFGQPEILYADGLELASADPLPKGARPTGPVNAKA